MSYGHSACLHCNLPLISLTIIEFTYYYLKNYIFVHLYKSPDFIPDWKIDTATAGHGITGTNCH